MIGPPSPGSFLADKYRKILDVVKLDVATVKASKGIFVEKSCRMIQTLASAHLTAPTAQPEDDGTPGGQSGN